MESLKKNWVLITVAIIIVVALGYKISKKRSSTTTTSGGGLFPSGSGSSGPLDENKLLMQGMTGAEVTELQKLINQGYTINGIDKNISTDGVFGPITANALFQLIGRWQITLADAKFMILNY